MKTLDKFVIIVKVEKTLKGSLDSIPSPSPSVKIQIMGAKFAWGVKAKHCFFENKKFVDFLFSKVCLQLPAMIRLYISSKLSQP